MPQGRRISEVKLNRAKQLVEEGEMGFVQIGERLGLYPNMISALAKKHNWKNPRKEHYSYPGNP